MRDVVHDVHAAAIAIAERSATVGALAAIADLPRGTRDAAHAALSAAVEIHLAAVVRQKVAIGEAADADVDGARAGLALGAGVRQIARRAGIARAAVARQVERHARAVAQLAVRRAIAAVHAAPGAAAGRRELFARTRGERHECHRPGEQPQSTPSIHDLGQSITAP